MRFKPDLPVEPSKKLAIFQDLDAYRTGNTFQCSGFLRFLRGSGSWDPIAKITDTGTDPILLVTGTRIPV
jgi:hypothetical protein